MLPDDIGKTPRRTFFALLLFVAADTAGTAGPGPVEAAALSSADS